jgi:hypothetical protein
VAKNIVKAASASAMWVSSIMRIASAVLTPRSHGGPKPFEGKGKEHKPDCHHGCELRPDYMQPRSR